MKKPFYSLLLTILYTSFAFAQGDNNEKTKYSNDSIIKFKVFDSDKPIYSILNTSSAYNEY